MDMLLSLPQDVDFMLLRLLRDIKLMLMCSLQDKKNQVVYVSRSKQIRIKKFMSFCLLRT